jgi:phytoene dehydrogenase-like protein
VVNEAAVDLTRAPAGRGLIKFVVHYVPSRIGGDATGRVSGRTWDDAKEAYADHIVDWLHESALPGLRDLITHRVVHSPVDLERRLPSAVHGTHQHGAFVPYQHGSMRPIPEMGQFRAPVPNVYLCGAGSHPGSGVSMGPGRNAARAVCDDLGLQFPGAG